MIRTRWTDEELKQFALHHLDYEIAMLCALPERIANAPDATFQNAALESFLLHARRSPSSWATRDQRTARH